MNETISHRNWGEKSRLPGARRQYRWPEPRPALQRYGMALLLVAGAGLLSYLIRVIGHGVVFAPFFAAILLSAWYGGLGPGLLATALSALVGDYVLLPPFFTLGNSPGEFIRVGVFILVAVLTSWLTSTRRQAEETLQEQAHLLDLAHTGIMAWDMDDRLLYWNTGAEELYGWSRAEALSRDVHALLQTQLPLPLAEIKARLLVEEHWDGELTHYRRDGRRLVLSTRWALQRDHQGRPLKVLEIVTDITELRRVEQAQSMLAEAGRLVSASLNQEMIFASIGALLVPRLADWCIIDMMENGAKRELGVFHQDPARREQMAELQRRYPLDPDNPWFQAIHTGQPELFDDISQKFRQQLARDAEHLELLRAIDLKSGLSVPLKARGQGLGVLFLGQAESGRRFDQADLLLAEQLGQRISIALDNARLYQAEKQARLAAQEEVEIRQQAEDKLKVLLQEKDVLLREVHHRVKNNLQAVSNLLYLQAQYIEDRKARQKFDETQHRVKSIALIHEKLYQTQNFTQVNFAEYIESLVQELIRSYRANSNLIKLNIHSDQTALGMDTAVPLGIIVNELVSNALKHAFPDDRAGEITITLSRADGDRLRLTVADNGVGLPEKIDPDSAPSLGLQLVQTLASHMDGSVEQESGQNGARFNVTFSLIPESE